MEQLLSRYEDTKPYYQFRTGLQTGILLEKEYPGFKIISRFSDDEILITNGKVTVMSQIPIGFVGSLVQKQVIEGMKLEEIEPINWKEVDLPNLSLDDWVSIEMMASYRFIGVKIS